MGFLSRKSKRKQEQVDVDPIVEELAEMEAAVGPADDRGEGTGESAGEESAAGPVAQSLPAPHPARSHSARHPQSDESPDASTPGADRAEADPPAADAKRSTRAENDETKPSADEGHGLTPPEEAEGRADHPQSPPSTRADHTESPSEDASLKDSDLTEGRLKAADLITPSRHQPEEPEAPVKRAAVIAFANQKGGVAKTTTTLNLAVAFAESGHRVLCVDLDPQGNLTMSQGINPDTVEKSLFDVLVHDMPISEIIEHREIDIAVASIDLAGAEIAMSTKIGRERSLEKALDEVIGDYDFVCIDTPPSLGLLTINALTAASKVIVPVQCEYLSMRGLVQLQNTLRMIQENLNPNVRIEGILPTMLDSRTVHAKEAVEILEENFGDLVFKSRIRKAVKFAEAPVKGSSVLKYDPSGNAAGYYRELAKEVLSNGSS